MLAGSEERVPRTAYAYRPLAPDEPLRIMELQPAANTEDPLRANLHHSNAGDVYEAISYVWGNPARSHFITLGSESCELAITKSADSAIRGLRHTKESRRLWIDGICINQSDHEEKAVQVRKMNKVYRDAEKVLIWLGDDEDDDGLGSRVVAFVKSCSLEIQSYPDSYLFSEMDSHEQAMRKRALDILHTPTLQPLSDFLNKPWFRRRWVVQEVACSREALIHCGKDSVSFADFAKLVEMSQAASISKLPITHDTLVSLRAILRMMRPHSDIWVPSINIPASCDSYHYIVHMLNTFGNHQCLDDRDKVFALLGLMEEFEDESHPIAVSYERTATDLYRDLGTVYILGRPFASAIFALLQCAGSFASKDFQQRQLPSFIPDWRNEKAFAPLLDYTFRWDYANTILRDDDPFEEPKYLQEEQKLILHGVVVGAIIDATPAAGPDNTENRLDIPLREWVRVLHNPVLQPVVLFSEKDLLLSISAIFWSNPYAAFFTLSPGFQETCQPIKPSLICYILSKLGWPLEEQLKLWSEGILKPDPPSRFYHKLFRWWEERGIDSLKQEIEQIGDQFPGYETIFQHSIAGRSLFVTDTGVLGLGPGSLKTGDILAVFADATIPFVLRPTGTPQEYRVVGDAYSHELMWHWKDWNGGFMPDPEARPDLSHLPKCSFVLV